jgi:glutamate-ammonia-ligase adenylyltransferase
MRRYHETELMRIGLRDILGLADFEQNLVEISALAEACLQYAFEAAARKTGLSDAPVAIIGLGKLGGAELNYGSDLDVVFVADSEVKNLPALQRLAVEIMSLLSERTAAGTVFEIDARLRPDGEKGLLVNTLSAYEEYYRRRAMLWEIQALSRARPVAGNQQVGREFGRLAAALTDFRASNVEAGFPAMGVSPESPSPRRTAKKRARQTKVVVGGLAAFQPEWRTEIANMRSRIEKERTPRGQERLAIKTGAGGLIDAEFIAQSLSMSNGWQEPNTLKALHLVREGKTLSTADADDLIENYRQLRRIEGVLRRWSFEGEAVLPDEPAPLYRVAVRCGYPDADTFMSAVGAWRAGIRRAFVKALAPRTS